MLIQGLGPAMTQTVIGDSALDFAYSSANHRPEPKSGECVSQSASRIQMVSYQISKPCETHPCPPNFHGALLVPVGFNSDFTP